MKRVAFLGALFVAFAAVVAPARGATLLPAPGTGHGVLSDDAPSDDRSLAFRPGIGGGCSTTPGTVRIQKSEHYGDDEPAVGLPVFVCVGEFPDNAVNVSIKPPSGPRIVLPVQSLGAGQSARLQVLVQPSPPRLRYRVTRDDRTVAAGPLRGDGSGVYQVVASGGGVVARESFTLVPAPKPQILNLNATDLLKVDKGTRLRFAVTGQRRQARFEVSIYGPEAGDGAHPSPHRTTIVARGDERGEAIITLDVAPNSYAGTFYAALEPYTPGPSRTGPEPLLAAFTVNRDVAESGLPYPVGDDVNLRAEPTAASTSLAVIPSGTTVTAQCYRDGELIKGPNGSTVRWDRVTWNGNTGYVTDAYIGTQDPNADPTIPAC